MAVRFPARSAIFWGEESTLVWERADCSGFWDSGSSKGATSSNSMGVPDWGPCSRQLKSQDMLRICSKDSSRLASVSQLFASQRGQRRRAAKVLDMRGLL